jgi:hypothetical protein
MSEYNPNNYSFKAKGNYGLFNNSLYGTEVFKLYHYQGYLFLHFSGKPVEILMDKILWELFHIIKP